MNWNLYCDEDEVKRISKCCLSSNDAWNCKDKTKERILCYKFKANMHYKDTLMPKGAWIWCCCCLCAWFVLYAYWDIFIFLSRLFLHIGVHSSVDLEGVNAKRFYLLLYSIALRTLSQSPLLSCTYLLSCSCFELYLLSNLSDLLSYLNTEQIWPKSFKAETKHRLNSRNNRKRRITCTLHKALINCINLLGALTLVLQLWDNQAILRV